MSRTTRDPGEQGEIGPSAHLLRPGSSRSGVIGPVLAVLAVLSVSVNLRPGASSVGPLLGRVTEGLGQGETFGGLLTALPGLCFGAIGVLAVPLARRLGLSGTVLVGFVITVLGLLLRPLMGSAVAFALLSVLVLAGPALGNVLVPAWVKRHGGERSVLLMTLYSIMLALGGTAAALLAIPLERDGPEGWRTSLMAWGLVAAVVIAVWALVLRRTGHDFPPAAPGGELHGGIVRSPTAIALTVTFGLQSMNAYIQMGWLPQILVDLGISPVVAGAFVAIVLGWGIIGGLVMPAVVARSRHLPLIVLGFGAATAVGWLGLALVPFSLALLWVFLLGVGGFIFPTTIALIPARSRDPRVTARLSGMVQPVGYVLAALGPFALGLLHELLGSWEAILTVLAVIALVMGAVGFRASAQRTVDDELRGHQTR